MSTKYLDMAITIAMTSRCRQKHGAVVVANGKVVAVAANKRVGDPAVHWRRAHIHAEVAAVQAAGKNAHGATVYVARINRNGVVSNSTPCKKCDGYLERAKVGQVVHT